MRRRAAMSISVAAFWRRSPIRRPSPSSQRPAAVVDPALPAGHQLFVMCAVAITKAMLTGCAWGVVAGAGRSYFLQARQREMAGPICPAGADRRRHLALAGAAAGLTTFNPPAGAAPHDRLPLSCFGGYMIGRILRRAAARFRAELGERLFICSAFKAVLVAALSLAMMRAACPWCHQRGPCAAGDSGKPDFGHCRHIGHRARVSVRQLRAHVICHPGSIAVMY